MSPGFASPACESQALRQSAARHSAPCAWRMPMLNDTAELSLGTFLLTTSTTVRVDGNGIEGTPVNLEHGLGITNHDSFRVDGYWRFLTRHKIRVMYFDQNRSASRTIDQEIEFSGETYPVNSTVSTRLDTRIIEVAYEYAFLRGEHYELAGTV